MIFLKGTLSADDLGEQRCVIKDSYVSLSFLRHIVKMQESAHRGYLSAIQALARGRRLQAATQQYRSTYKSTLWKVQVIRGGGCVAIGQVCRDKA